ncbi:ABC transporter substrate-binding protein [Microvirga sp. VF16]|uniref:ABC transporter substrate-binding protein n=1 Tax=Microvirga sp. VF16 TaxID=2807101 RepID=UPI00193E33B8|nr:ABC transporter substrate-binding protein [Microvirga sp. VF16]QRM34278.1 peptide ABC transporter substrate-binding protein [Microvirga sp. VF16]
MRTKVTFALASMVFALSAGAATAQERVLRTILASDIRGTMPGKSPDVSTGTVLQNIYEGLVAWKSDGTVAPMLAETIDVQDNGALYTFMLREGVKFHNGAPLTAKEVAWTWQQFLDPKSGWVCRGTFDGDNIKIESVEAIGERKVAFKLAKPSGALLSAMARSDCDSTGIAHPDSMAADGSWTQAIGTGPYKLSQWRKGQFVELVRHQEYASRAEPTDGYAGAKDAKIDRVRLEIVPDPSSTKLAVLSGNIDLWADVDPSVYAEVKASVAVGTSVAQTAAVYTLPMQNKDPVLKDPRVRRAIAMAIDSQALSQALTAGTSEVNRSLVPVTSRHYGPAQKTGVGYDPEGARRLLTEAGYKGEKIVILTNKQFPIMGDTAIFVEAMLKAVGINAEVEVVEFATQFQRYYSGRYQMTVWNVAPYLDPMFLFDRFIGDKIKQADKVWDSPAAREKLTKLYAAATPEEKQRALDALQQQFVANMPLVVWANDTTIAAFTSRLKGYEAWAGTKPRFWNVGF